MSSAVISNAVRNLFKRNQFSNREISHCVRYDAIIIKFSTILTNEVSKSPNQQISMIAQTPKPPYYAVIFTSLRTDEQHAEYSAMAVRMEELAKEQPGYLGIESAREGLGITVSYWESLEAIKSWKQHSEHVIAQQIGRSDWYTHYKTRIALVERDYGFEM